jgi:hypothetical protein
VQTIPPKVWESVRSDYVSGEGSLRTLADRHGLKVSSVEKKCRAENWTALRQRRAEGVLARLIPPDVAPPPPQLPITAPLSAEWLQEQQLAHFSESAQLIQVARKKIGDHLATASNLNEKSLNLIANSIATLAEASAKLLGLHGKKKEVRERRPVIVPLDVEASAVAPVENENNAVAG